MSTNQVINYSPEEIQVIKNSVAKGTTDIELRYFISVCKSVGLNPLTKEIWCIKDQRSNLLVFAGRDGMLAYAQRNPAFGGIRSCDVCENDEFTLDMINPQNNTHRINAKNRGKILGAYAIVFRKGGEPTIAYVNFDEYNRGASAWKTHPAAMIRKVAETQALKMAFGMAGVQSEHEWKTDGGTAVPLVKTLDQSRIDEIMTAVENIEEVKELNKYFRTLATDEQKMAQVIDIFSTRKETIDATVNA